MKKLLIAAAAIVFIVWGIWFIALPESVIVGALNFKNGPVEVETTGFKKGLFYNFTLDGIELKKDGKRLIGAEDISGRVDVLGLPLMKTAVKFSGSIGGGKLEGSAVFRKDGQTADISITDAEIGTLLPGAKGLAEVEIHVKDGSGEARLSVKDAEITAEGITGMKIPSLTFHTARGALGFTRKSMELRSLSLEGPDIFARLKGVIKGGRADMELEIMPEKTVDPLVLGIIGKYKVAPGYFKIPIKRELNF